MVELVLTWQHAIVIFTARHREVVRFVYLLGQIAWGVSAFSYLRGSSSIFLFHIKIPWANPGKKKYLYSKYTKSFNYSDPHTKSYWL